MSGRQLTLTDTTSGELSKVELDMVQRIAIARLQGMDISVSFNLLKGAYMCAVMQLTIIHVGRGKLGKLSTSMRRKISNERPTSKLGNGCG